MRRARWQGGSGPRRNSYTNGSRAGALSTRRPTPNVSCFVSGKSNVRYLRNSHPDWHITTSFAPGTSPPPEKRDVSRRNVGPSVGNSVVRKTARPSGPCCCCSEPFGGEICPHATETARSAALIRRVRCRRIDGSPNGPLRNINDGIDVLSPSSHFYPSHCFRPSSCDFLLLHLKTQTSSNRKSEV